MTKPRMGTYLSISRVKGLEYFVKGVLSAYDLGELMWPGHKMAKVNARAIVRDLLLGEYIELVPTGDDCLRDTGEFRFRATQKSAAIIANPPWLCRYCTLDVTNSMRRLWHYPCEGCAERHQVCRWCKKHLLRATGDFPYMVKVRNCPGKIQVPKRPEHARKKEKIEEVQGELAT